MQAKAAESSGYAGQFCCAFQERVWNSLFKPTLSEPVEVIDDMRLILAGIDVTNERWRTTSELQDVMNERLKLISGKEPLVLDPIDGQEILATATDAFRYIDSNFEHWSCNVAGLPSIATPVQVYEMARDSNFQEMFGGFGVALDRLALTQAQIKEFVKRYPGWLKKGGNGTFFLFNTGDDFFVAVVYLFSDGRLGARVRRFTLKRVFRAKKRHRLVLKSHWALGGLPEAKP